MVNRGYSKRTLSRERCKQSTRKRYTCTSYQAGADHGQRSPMKFHFPRCHDLSRSPLSSLHALSSIREATSYGVLAATLSLLQSLLSWLVYSLQPFLPPQSWSCRHFIIPLPFPPFPCKQGQLRKLWKELFVFMDFSCYIDFTHPMSKLFIKVMRQSDLHIFKNLNYSDFSFLQLKASSISRDLQYSCEWYFHHLMLEKIMTQRIN